MLERRDGRTVEGEGIAASSRRPGSARRLDRGEAGDPDVFNDGCGGEPPPHYVCNAQFGSPGRCVPPVCANPKSAEFGGPYCALFE